MYSITPVNSDVTYIGGSDRRLALFENAYPLENGMAYNSYLIRDEKTALMDTVDRSIESLFRENLVKALDGRDLDYIIVQHMEPDHCATLGMVLSMYPNARVVGTMQVKRMVSQFYGIDITDRFDAVKEGQELSLGAHTLKFITAPFVHWPEVMMTYDIHDKALYSADAFGMFGALSGNIFADETDMWTANLDEARRYYTNIVGRYGKNVQNVLKKAAGLDIEMICPLHGPVIRSDLAFYIDKYDKWSSYTPEEDTVLIAYGSIYGGTENAADVMAGMLAQRGVKNIRMYDVSKTHYSYIVAEAFRCSKIVFASPTQDSLLFTEMEAAICAIRAKGLTNRTVALIENGTWNPSAAKHMRELLEPLGMNILDLDVSIKSTPAADDLEKLSAMADALANA
ncbi:MAG: FprA family A-type flavoprotein [Oscillospiraceae bacterium]|nr:FprA family A-type flavoprotein [Oscillospiraceae bacterium]